MLSRPPIDVDPRRCFTDKQRAEIFQNANGRCSICDAKIQGAWIAGHIKAHSMGGGTTVENGRVECPTCAAVTHKEDTGAASQAEKMAGRKGQYARRKNNGSKLQSRNTLGGEEGRRRREWAKKIKEGKNHVE